jgi:hypothetical protein
MGPFPRRTLYTGTSRGVRDAGRNSLTWAETPDMSGSAISGLTTIAIPSFTRRQELGFSSSACCIRSSSRKIICEARSERRTLVSEAEVPVTRVLLRFCPPRLAWPRHQSGDQHTSANLFNVRASHRSVPLRSQASASWESRRWSAALYTSCEDPVMGNLYDSTREARYVGFRALDFGLSSRCRRLWCH